MQISGGAMLRKAREATGLHIAALAVSLKVPVKKLEALEADRFDLLPDTVFARALALSVCRTLNMDPTPVLESMPHTGSPNLKTDDSGINTPFRSVTGGSGFWLRDQFSRPLVWLVSGLLIGALILVLLPFVNRDGLTGAAKLDARAPVPSLAALPPSVATIAASVAVVAPLAGASESESPVMVDGSGLTTGMVVFKAREGSWVEVVDAVGVVQVRKTMRSGEIVGASGTVPLKVVVGRADVTEVLVRDQPYDLTAIAKDNVARFEVK